MFEDLWKFYNEFFKKELKKLSPLPKYFEDLEDSVI